MGGFFGSTSDPLCVHMKILTIISGSSRSRLFSSVRRALSSKLRGPGFKSQPGSPNGPVTIIICVAQSG